MSDEDFDSETPVGVIGLGLLGGAIAERLISAGFCVHGFDLRPDCRAAFAETGGVAVESARDVAACPRIVLSLPEATVSELVVQEMQGELQPGSLIIDTTTGHPERMKAIAETLAERGVTYLDAAVGGSSAQCRRGDVVVMGGGDAAGFARCRDIFAAFTRETFHVGSCGSGARMKLVFNLVLGLNRAVLAEGLCLAKRFGINADVILQVLQSGAASSAVMESKGRKMADGDFTPQARLSQHLKDVRLILENGRECNAVLPFSELHERLLQSLVESGFGEADNSAVVKAFE